MTVNKRQGLTVQDAVPIRTVAVQDDSKLSAQHNHETGKVQPQEQAKATDAFRAASEKGPEVDQSFEVDNILRLLKKTSFFPQT